MEVKIRIIICDSHAEYRENVQAALSACDDFEVIAEIDDGIEAVDLCQKQHPDVIVMDIMLPRMNGVVAAYFIHQHCPSTRVIILTGFSEKILIWATMQGGAAGYLLKGLPMEDLVSAIRSVYKGRLALSPKVIQTLVGHGYSSAPDFKLTPREKEVLGYIVKGMSNDAIAYRMVVSPATAKKHVSNILAKLNVENRAEAVAVALRYKLLK